MCKQGYFILVEPNIYEMENENNLRVNRVEHVVNVNHPTNKAIVHSMNCWKFKNRRRDKTLNGRWSVIEHEPFKKLEEALDYAKRTNKKNFDTCAFCIK